MEVLGYKLEDWKLYTTTHPKPYTDYIRYIKNDNIKEALGFIRIFHADQNGTLNLTVSVEFDEVEKMYRRIHGTYVLPYKISQIDQAKQHIDQFLLQFESLKAFI